jgi:hypothetical protein
MNIRRIDAIYVTNFEYDEMDSFVTAAAFYFIVITMRNWRSSVTAILGV